jgi:peptidoglycan/xylan/chitin deacetylase (PgdA/CDA1 family)
MVSERFPYSPIVSRPPLRWPGGKKLALYVVPNLEHYEYVPDPVRLRNPYPRSPHPDVLSYGARDYGNRVGFWRLLELFDRHRVRCTAAINIACFEHYPEIQAACDERGWDYMCHGIYNTQYLWGLKEAEERAIIADCVASFARLTGRQLAGWESPGGGNTVNTPDLLAEAGIRYTCDWFHDDQPVPVSVRSGRLISLPYSIDVNDGRDFRSHIEAEEFARSVIDQFDRLLADGDVTGRVMCLPLHPYIFGQPHRIGELDRILAHITGRDDVWYATGSEIVDWYTQAHLPQFEAHLAELAKRPAP